MSFVAGGCEDNCRYGRASSLFLPRLLLLPVGFACIEMFGVEVSRSNAVTSADDAAQLRDLREIRVPEKGHDSRADIIHSCRFCRFVWMFGDVSRGWCRRLGPASDADVGEAAALNQAGQTRLLRMRRVRVTSVGLHCRSRVVSRLQCG
jgi:hypothetical protein